MTSSHTQHIFKLLIISIDIIQSLGIRLLFQLIKRGSQRIDRMINMMSAAMLVER